MALNIGTRAMIKAIRDVQPGIGLKRLTAEINERLPPEFKVDKHNVRDFCRELDSAVGGGSASPGLKPRDEAFAAVVKEAFVAFRDAEREFFLDLDRQLHKADDFDLVIELRYYGQILFNLKGLLPITFMFCDGSPDNDTAPIHFINNLVFTCLAPVLERFDLEAYGFSLHHIMTGRAFTSFRIPEFRGAWLFVDSQSASWPQVRDMYITPSPTRLPPTQEEGYAVLGHPASLGENEIVLEDYTEQKVLEELLREEQPGVKVTGVGVQTFGCVAADADDWVSLMMYLQKRCDAAAEVGIELVVNTSRHLELQAVIQNGYGV
ncbi:unnamed protein product [Discula destructiva]